MVQLMVTKFVRIVPLFAFACIMVNPREDAGGLSREYVLRIPSVSKKATKGAPLYSHSRWYGVKQ